MTVVSNASPRVQRSARWACVLLLVMAVWSPGVAAIELQAMAPGVYGVIANAREPSSDNGGVSANSGVIVGSEGVTVIDPGPNRAAGLALRRAIRRVTAKPVVAVIATHAHPENVLAADALLGPATPLIAHERTFALMRDRCADCFERLSGLVGRAAMAGTRIRVPDQTVPDGITERTYGGRTLRLIHVGWGHTAGDLAVLDRQTGTLFAGGLVSNRVLPDTHEARVRSWIAALAALSQQPVRRVVPGQGNPGPASLIGEFSGYLLALLARVEVPYREQLSVFDVLADGDLPDYANWSGYAAVHPLNLQHVYAELEREDFASR